MKKIETEDWWALPLVFGENRVVDDAVEFEVHAGILRVTTRTRNEFGLLEPEETYHFKLVQVEQGWSEV